VLIKNIPGDIGYGLQRGGDKLIKLNKVKVVMRCEKYNGMPYYVLTSYLER
jgi:hypothetical protein